MAGGCSQATCLAGTQAITQPLPADPGRAPAETQLLFSTCKSAGSGRDPPQVIDNGKLFWPASGPKAQPPQSPGSHGQKGLGLVTIGRQTATRSRRWPCRQRLGGWRLGTEFASPPKAGTRLLGPAASSGSGPSVHQPAQRPAAVWSGGNRCNWRELVVQFNSTPRNSGHR